MSSIDAHQASEDAPRKQAPDFEFGDQASYANHPYKRFAVNHPKGLAPTIAVQFPGTGPPSKGLGKIAKIGPVSRTVRRVGSAAGDRTGRPLAHSWGPAIVKSNQCISVYIVAEVTVHREGLSAFFGSLRDCAVVGAASTLTSSPVQVPDVYVVDCTDMAPSDLLAQRAVAACGEVPIVVFGLPDSPAVILAFLEAGAAGYVRKDASLDELHITVHRAARYGHCLNDKDVTAVLRRIQSNDHISPAARTEYRNLTSREREVALLMKMNRSNNEIAQELGISIHTVKNHVHNALFKLGINSRHEADRVVARILSDSL